ncbi:MAG TPA: ATP-binding protein [Nitrospirota bacterium]|nr:ATP-binding protein [Nitrospirota bacterium]
METIRPMTSLAKKLMLALMILVTFVMSIVGFYWVNSEERSASTELETRATQMANLLGKTLAGPLWNIDMKSIQGQLESIMADPEVFSVALFARDVKQPLAFNKRGGHVVDSIEREAPVTYVRDKPPLTVDIGAVHLVYTRYYMYQSLARMRVLIGVVLLLLLASLSVATYILLKRMVQKPVGALVAVTRRIADGDFEARIPIASHDEIGALAETFNIMTYKLRRTMDGLRASESKYRGIFEHAVEGIFQTTCEGRIIGVNPAAVRMLAYDSPDELISCLSSIQDQPYVHPEAQARLLCLLREQGSLLGFECQFYRKDKQKIWVSISATMVRDDMGEPLFIEGLMTDISARKHAEEMLAQKTTELERSNKELEHFASIVSHDLRAPLSTIGGFAQNLSENYTDKLDIKAQRALDHIIKGTLRMELLINDLLTYARVTSGGQSFKTIHMNAILNAVRSNLRSIIEKNDAIITCDDLPIVYGDEVLLIQLFQNLIGNAIKYRGERTPRIHVAAERLSAVLEFGSKALDFNSDNSSLKGSISNLKNAMETDWLFSVMDNGIGIDAAYYDKIFVLFQRLHAESQYSGTGIGLAICKKIVEQHGGKIWVDSKIGKGSIFYFTISDRSKDT